MAEERQVSYTADQIMQMAQQEEAVLANKQALLERLSGILGETITAKETLKELQAGKGKILVNIGSAVLIEAQAADAEKCKRGFGEHVYKEETIKETIEWLSKKEEQLKKEVDRTAKEYTDSKSRLTALAGILKQVDAEKRKAIQKARQQPVTLSK